MGYTRLRPGSTVQNRLVVRDLFFWYLGTLRGLKNAKSKYFIEAFSFSGHFSSKRGKKRDGWAKFTGLGYLEAFLSFLAATIRLSAPENPQNP